MAKLALEPVETSPGIFEHDTLPEFTPSQAWQKDAYWSEDYFGELTSGSTLHQITNRRALPKDLNDIYSNLVLTVGDLHTFSFKIDRQHIGALQERLSDDPEALTVLAGLGQKIDQREADWLQAKRARLGELIAGRRDRLHMLINVKKIEDKSGKIEGFFGKLWGITIDANNNDLLPVVVGKDQTPAKLSYKPRTLWLYVGTLDSEKQS